MKAAYFKEKHKYKFNNIVEQLNKCGANETPDEHLIIQKLILLQIIKKVSKDYVDGFELIENYETNLPVEKDEQAFYVFNYVGIIKVNGVYIICYPKYFSEVPNRSVPSASKLSYVIKSIEKYKKSKGYRQEGYVQDADLNKEGDFFAIAIALLNDYYENGLYTNSKKVIENNGNGDIDWDRTIESNIAYISNGIPYYLDYKTSRRKVDPKDYFTEIHKNILNDIASKLTGEDDDSSVSVDMSELLGVPIMRFETDNVVDLNDDEVKEYVSNKIDSELKVQFVSRKQELLKIFKHYISGFFGNDDKSEFYFGTNSYHMVWENVCKTVFNDCLNKSVNELNGKYKIFKNLPSGRSKKVIDLISKPMWSYAQKESDDTLIPDGICIGSKNKKTTFNIIDAKYYIPVLEKDKKPMGVPGIESITKQYLYQMAYEQYLQPRFYKSISNYFLVPYDPPYNLLDKKLVTNKGEVKLDFMPKELSPIRVRYLKADIMLKAYLSERILAVNELD